MSNFKAHRGPLPPNQQSFVQIRGHGCDGYCAFNIANYGRHGFLFARFVAWLLNLGAIRDTTEEEK